MRLSNIFLLRLSNNPFVKHSNPNGHTLVRQQFLNLIHVLKASRCQESHGDV